MLTNQNSPPENNIKHQSDFEEKRQKLKLFFENNQLKNTTQEFYQVQQNFHKAMSELVDAFIAVMNFFPNENIFLLSKLLEPYRILINNPFHNPNDPFQRPTGDLETDISHILQVIDTRDGLFKRALIALLDCISNLECFNLYIKERQKNDALVKMIKEQLKCHSWLTVQGYIDQPFQNLIRYELLLGAIKKSLVQSGCESTENILVSLSNTLEYLVPELRNINDCKETILVLNKIERALDSLVEFVKSTADWENKEDLIKYKKQIEFVKISVHQGKLKVIKDTQNIGALFEGVFELLQGLVNDETCPFKSTNKDNPASFVSWAISFFDNQGNKKNNTDPLAELRDVIKELGETLLQIEALKNIHAKFLKRT